MPPTRTPAQRAETAVATDTKLEEAVLAAALKKLVKQEQSRTAALKEFAEAILTLRIKLNDLPGRSTAYREAVGRVYQKARLDERAVAQGTSRAALGAAIRYHVAEAIRAKGLAEAAGIALDSPSQRLAGARKALAAQRLAPPSDLMELFGTTLDWLSSLETRFASDGQVGDGVVDMLDRLEAEVRRLRQLVRGRPSPRRRTRTSAA
jgi:hypothetical protein